MKKILIFIAVAATVVGCSTRSELLSYVDPKIGTGDHGHVFVGANVPFGMVQVGPTSIPQEWDWCSGYHASDSTLIGFSHTHLSGTGIGDLFDVTVMPVVGEVTYARGKHDDPNSGMWSYADRSKEVARPGYYSVPVMRYNVLAEITATSRVGYHRYTFPSSDQAAIVIDLQNGGCWDRVIKSEMRVEGNNRIVGVRHSSGWARRQSVYFVAEFSKPFDTFEVKNTHYGRANFSTKEGEKIMMKVAISPVSIEGAKANLASELPKWPKLESVVTKAEKLWTAELEKAQIESHEPNAKRIFYTALYHTMVAPSVFCDVDGSYRGADGETHPNPGHTTYTTYSLWDTYRAQMPLLSILHPEKMGGMINTMLNIHDEQGRLPVWHLWGNETDCMVGNPGVISVADAIVKQQKGVDLNRAYEAVQKTSMHPGRGNAHRIEIGYIPFDKMNSQSVAYDMEYAIADAAAAAAAKAVDKSDDAAYFEQRSHSYRNYFDPESRFIRAKNSKGEWREPFDPYFSNHNADDYCEGNAWQYTWLMPHDAEGMAECFGGKKQMIEKLDSLFIISSEVTGDKKSADISGLIGQYAHGNEPSHHTLYLYALLGEPWKCADKVREVLTTLYFDAPAGLSGNEDVGQMSAWYVMSALGLYQVEPASARYWFGSPIISEATLKVEGGQMRIVAENNSEQNKYIQRVWLNGQEYRKPWISHADLTAGGELRFEMGAEKSLWY
ncbi:MAG: glycoside hydrolase family 92 protein [Rikenellaceae bacterium]|nr:glycoside hydrolase family 92 protein [Rikenellaceae bacterium]